VKWFTVIYILVYPYCQINEGFHFVIFLTVSRLSLKRAAARPISSAYRVIMGAMDLFAHALQNRMKTKAPFAARMRAFYEWRHS
jgi:hypothetical protein